MRAPLFENREQAGRELAERLAGMALTDPLVVALPRGGVPVAYEIAKKLGAPLELILVRKVGAPGQRELAMAAIVEGAGSEMVVNQEVVDALGVSERALNAAADAERRELKRRLEAYRAGRGSPQVKGRDVVVVDDGVATGASLMAALKALRKGNPKRLIAALPVGPADSIEALGRIADEVVCLARPEPFYAIGLHFADFHQLGDGEVTRILAQARGLSDWSSA